MSAIDVKFVTNKDQVLNSAGEAIARALEAVGLQAEAHAKAHITASVPRSGSWSGSTGAMRNSVSHQVVESEKAVYIGSNLEYALYNEVGTGIYAEGGGGRKDPWVYVDDKGEAHRTVGMKPIHFLKKAVEENAGEYQRLIEEMLKA